VQAWRAQPEGARRQRRLSGGELHGLGQGEEQEQGHFQEHEAGWCCPVQTRQLCCLHGLRQR